MDSMQRRTDSTVLDRNTNETNNLQTIKTKMKTVIYLGHTVQMHLKRLFVEKVQFCHLPLCHSDVQYDVLLSVGQERKYFEECSV